MDLSSFTVQWAPKDASFQRQSAFWPFKVIQGHRFWYQSKAHIWLPIIVINSNHGPILHRYWDTATYWLKIAYFSYPFSYLAPSIPKFPLEFRAEVNREETRVMGLPRGESCMILTSSVFDWFIRVTDGQTDRQTDGRAIAYARYSIIYIFVCQVGSHKMLSRAKTCS